MTDQFAQSFDDDSDDDRIYFRDRAAWHVRRAAISDDASTRTLHQRFADLYARRALSPSST